MSAWSYLEKLTELPHRGSASQAEATAARLISSELRQLGYTVSYQHFRAPRKTLYHGPAIILSFYLFAYLGLGTFYPWLGLFLMVLSVMPLVGELLGWPLNFDVILRTFRSRNVVADQESASDMMPPMKPHVIITAHYDTQFGSWLFAPFFRPYLKLFFSLTYGVLLLLPVATVFRTFFPHALVVRFMSQLCVIYLIAALVWLVANSLGGRYINGANDNGSGVALALALAEQAAKGTFPAVDLTFVFTGSEETGTRGMLHFMEQYHHLDPEHTFFINLDNLGAGIPRYLEGEGMISYTSYDSSLIALAQQISTEKSGRVIAQPNLLLPTDGLFPARAGFRTITFIATNEQGNIPHYHWHTDTCAHVDKDLLSYLEEYLQAFLHRMPQWVGQQPPQEPESEHISEA